LGENADYVRNWVDAWNRGDVHELMAGIGPAYEWVVAREHPAATTHRGPDKISEYLADWRRTMPDFKVEIEELLEVGDKVLSVTRMSGTGSGSGATIEVRTATLTTFRDGSPVRTEEFLDPEEARRIFVTA
jgi:ketosteroid isomerase-like protein